MSAEERVPPKRVRVTKLQEAQVETLVSIEHAVAELHGAVGIATTPRASVELARLPRDHDVYVAEADHDTAGYLAWVDQAPGVAVIKALMVAPELHRFGIGSRLLRDFGEGAQKVGLDHAVVAVWEKASWALAFLAVRGFQPVDGKVPDKLAEWQAQHAASLVPGQRFWWAKTEGLGFIPGLPRPS
jgi:amino-acid N-acetyltransferase